MSRNPNRAATVVNIAQRKKANPNKRRRSLATGGGFTPIQPPPLPGVDKFTVELNRRIRANPGKVIRSRQTRGLARAQLRAGGGVGGGFGGRSGRTGLPPSFRRTRATRPNARPARGVGIASLRAKGSMAGPAKPRLRAASGGALFGKSILQSSKGLLPPRRGPNRSQVARAVKAKRARVKRASPTFGLPPRTPPAMRAKQRARQQVQSAVSKANGLRGGSFLGDVGKTLKKGVRKTSKVVRKVSGALHTVLGPVGGRGKTKPARRSG